MCAWFTPNETEASFYLEGNSGMSNVEKTATALHESGARNLILKMGQRGVYILSEGVTALQIPAIQVEAVDSTAAGDTFNGAFAAALVQGRSIEFCARFAVTAAGISVTRPGAQVSMPTLSEVKHAMTGADAPL
jgi:ribokinase